MLQNQVLRRTINNKINTELIIVSQLEQDSYSPYYLAIKFNLEDDIFDSL